MLYSTTVYYYCFVYFGKSDHVVRNSHCMHLWIQTYTEMTLISSFECLYCICIVYCLVSQPKLSIHNCEVKGSHKWRQWHPLSFVWSIDQGNHAPHFQLHQQCSSAEGHQPPPLCPGLDGGSAHLSKEQRAEEQIPNSTGMPQQGANTAVME